jgi:hypothetical protein
MNGIPSEHLNALFTQKLDTGEGREKTAAYGGLYIRDKLREVAFSRKVIPPKQITRNECQRSVNHDTLVRIVDVEPESRAMAITFRGEPDARYIRAARYEIPFHTIASEVFEKTEQELMAYEMPITKVIEDNTVKDIQAIEDREFLIHIEACVQALQLEANGGTPTKFSRTTVNGGTVAIASVVKGELALIAGGSDDFTVHAVQRPDFVNLFKLMDGNELKGELLLLTEVDADDILQWTVEDFGDRVQSETAVEGYRYNTVLGRKVIRTIKTKILRAGNIYLFTAPEFFGRFYILNQTKFYIDKKANVISWQSWEDIGMGIGNIAAVRKLELYRGSVTPGATDTGYADRLPLDEEDLYGQNNRADQGLTFPQVDQF